MRFSIISASLRRSAVTTCFLAGSAIGSPLITATPVAAAPPVTAAMHAKLTLSPRTPRYEELTTFTVRLTGTDNKPIAGAHVSINLVIPVMDMGKNVVLLKPKATGSYTGQGRFTMIGRWNVVVTAIKGKQKITMTTQATVK